MEEPCGQPTYWTRINDYLAELWWKIGQRLGWVNFTVHVQRKASKDEPNQETGAKPTEESHDGV